MLIRSALALLLLASARGATSVARVFADHMVLQRDAAVAIFGRDEPGQKVSVTFAGQSRATTTADDGRWQVDLTPLDADATGRDLTVVGSSPVTLRDVLVGEVWLAAGQSNMNFPVKDCATRPDPENFPLIRMANWEGRVGAAGGQVYRPQDYRNLTPENHYSGTWETLDETSVRQQSGVACFFANALARELGVPVGIVDISLGGTTTEAFIAPAVLRQNPYLAAAFGDPRQARTLGSWATARIAGNLAGYTHADPALPHPHPFAPGFLHATAMPHLVPFRFRGVIWYQGESNAEFTAAGFRWNGERIADHQTVVMKTLVDSWRAGFRQPAMPFYMVELPRVNAPNRALWPFYREAQQRVSRDTDGVEIATVTGSGSADGNVHPPDKEPVGEGLARIALAKIHGAPIAHSGPIFAEQKIVGSAIHLRFEHTGGGLTDLDGDKPRNFEIAGADRKFVPAEATIRGDHVRVSAAAVPRPVAVRHAWHMDIDIDLAGSDGLAAPAFRTDSWLAAPGRKLRVACIGDSITFGAGLGDPAREAYPARLATLLGDGHEVRGFGRSGSGIHRPDKKYAATREFRDALAYEPDIVICNLGINDITQWGTYTRDDLVTEYRELIDAFASLPTAPYIIQWYPLAPLFPGQKFHGDPDVETLNHWLAGAVAHSGVDSLDMSAPLKDHPEWFPDHIHPNAAGSKAIAEATFRRLRELDQAAPTP